MVSWDRRCVYETAYFLIFIVSFTLGMGTLSFPDREPNPVRIHQREFSA